MQRVRTPIKTTGGQRPPIVGASPVTRPFVGAPSPARPVFVPTLAAARPVTSNDVAAQSNSRISGVNASSFFSVNDDTVFIMKILAGFLIAWAAYEFNFEMDWCESKAAFVKASNVYENQKFNFLPAKFNIASFDGNKPDCKCVDSDVIVSRFFHKIPFFGAFAIFWLLFQREIIGGKPIKYYYLEVRSHYSFLWKVFDNSIIMVLSMIVFQALNYYWSFTTAEWNKGYSLKDGSRIGYWIEEFDCMDKKHEVFRWSIFDWTDIKIWVCVTAFYSTPVLRAFKEWLKDWNGRNSSSFIVRFFIFCPIFFIFLKVFHSFVRKSFAITTFNDIISVEEQCLEVIEDSDNNNIPLVCNLDLSNMLERPFKTHNSFAVFDFDKLCRVVKNITHNLNTAMHNNTKGLKLNNNQTLTSIGIGEKGLAQEFMYLNMSQTVGFSLLGLSSVFSLANPPIINENKMKMEIAETISYCALSKSLELADQKAGFHDFLESKSEALQDFSKVCTGAKPNHCKRPSVEFNRNISEWRMKFPVNTDVDYKEWNDNIMLKAMYTEFIKNKIFSYSFVEFEEWVLSTSVMDPESASVKYPNLQGLWALLSASVMDPKSASVMDPKSASVMDPKKPKCYYHKNNAELLLPSWNYVSYCTVNGGKTRKFFYNNTECSGDARKTEEETFPCFVQKVNSSTATIEDWRLAFNTQSILTANEDYKWWDNDLEKVIWNDLIDNNILTGDVSLPVFRKRLIALNDQCYPDKEKSFKYNSTCGEDGKSQKFIYNNANCSGDAQKTENENFPCFVEKIKTLGPNRPKFYMNWTELSDKISKKNHLSNSFRPGDFFRDQGKHMFSSPTMSIWDFEGIGLPEGASIVTSIEDAFFYFWRPPMGRHPCVVYNKKLFEDNSKNWEERKDLRDCLKRYGRWFPFLNNGYPPAKIHNNIQAIVSPFLNRQSLIWLFWIPYYLIMKNFGTKITPDEKYYLSLFVAFAWNLYFAFVVMKNYEEPEGLVNDKLVTKSLIDEVLEKLKRTR